MIIGMILVLMAHHSEGNEEIDYQELPTRGQNIEQAKEEESILYDMRMAQQGIKGTITSAEDGKRIGKARLSMKGEFVSDSNGEFWLFLLPGGNYSIGVEAENFLPTEVQFNVLNDRPTNINFALEQITPTEEITSSSTAREINVNILNNVQVPRGFDFFGPGS